MARTGAEMKAKAAKAREAADRKKASGSRSKKRTIETRAESRDDESEQSNDEERDKEGTERRRKRRRTSEEPGSGEDNEDEDQDEEMEDRPADKRKEKGKARATGPDSGSDMSDDSAIATARASSSKVKKAASTRGDGDGKRKKARDGAFAEVTKEREGSMPMDVFHAKWEDSIEKLRSESVKVDAEQELAARDLKAALIGSAHLKFGGLNDIHGVVDLADDPNARANPRTLIRSHVDILYQSIRLPNGKKDHEAPVAVMVSRKLLSSELIEQMEKSDATNILSQPPALVLESPTSDEEKRLENELFLKRRGDTSLSNEELHEIKEKLDELRAVKKLCKLLNGNHRIRAMLRLNEEVNARV
ncbi:hypothetical protein FRC09_014131, partial [Ceratobasidium sp. 395]